MPQHEIRASPLAKITFPHTGHTWNRLFSILEDRFIFLTACPQSSSGTEICRALPSGSSRETSGNPRPVSHLDTAAKLFSQFCLRHPEFFAQFPDHGTGHAVVHLPPLLSQDNIAEDPAAYNLRFVDTVFTGFRPAPASCLSGPAVSGTGRYRPF